MNDTAQRPDLADGSSVTIGDKYGYAMEITTEPAAREYFEACVKHTMSFGKSRAVAERIERSNIGYYAGYYDNETRKRVERLFLCAHPVFGKATDTPADPATAFESGRAMATHPPLGRTTG